MDSGCGSVGKAGASNAKYTRFESNHFTFYQLFWICIEKTKLKKKGAGNGPFLKQVYTSLISGSSPTGDLFHSDRTEVGAYESKQTSLASNYGRYVSVMNANAQGSAYKLIF